MTIRTATCRCGQLRITCDGEPIRISVCHCLNCQKRSGSAFAAQARWPVERTRLTGDWREWRPAEGDGGAASFRFCPTCGSTLCFVNDALPDTIAVATGAFADPGFPPPHYSVFESRKHAWVAILGDEVIHD